MIDFYQKSQKNAEVKKELQKTLDEMIQNEDDPKEVHIHLR